MVPTIHGNLNRVAPLHGGRLTPVEGAVRLLGRLQPADRGRQDAPVPPTAGRLPGVFREASDGPSWSRAAAAQTEGLILQNLRRVRTHAQRCRLGHIWGQTWTLSGNSSTVDVKHIDGDGPLMSSQLVSDETPLTLQV